MLDKLQLQNLAWTSTSKSWPIAVLMNKSLALGPNVSSQICNKLLPTWSSASTWATVTKSTSFEMASLHARATSIKFTEQQLVSESVSDKHSQWSDSGPIKIAITKCWALDIEFSGTFLQGGSLHAKNICYDIFFISLSPWTIWPGKDWFKSPFPPLILAVKYLTKFKFKNEGQG